MSAIYFPLPVWNESNEEYWWAITTPDKGHRPAFYALANMPKFCDEHEIAALPRDNDRKAEDAIATNPCH